MHYAPHMLQKRLRQVQQPDGLGRPTVIQPEEEWTDICKCRCDHNSDQVRNCIDGKMYVPAYKAVCSSNTIPIFPNDEVRIVCEDGSEKCRGTVTNAPKLNYLPYATVFF